MASFKKTIYVLNYPITIEIPNNLSEYTNDVPFVAKDSLSSLSTLTLYNEVYLHPLSSDKQSYINFGIYDSMSGKSYRLPLSLLGSLIPDYSSGGISSVFVLSQNGYLQKTSLSDLITYISDNAKTYKKVPSDLSNTYVFSWVDNQLSKVSLLSIITTTVSKEVSKQTEGKSITVYSLYLTPDYINTNSDMSAYYDGANTLISMSATGISSNGVLSTVVFDNNNYITLTANGQERKLAATGSSISLNIKSMFPIPVKSGIIFKLYVNNQIAASQSLKFVACGQDGAQGKDGKSGKDGKDGTSGTSGKDGADATQYVLYIDPDFFNVNSDMTEYMSDSTSVSISAAMIAAGLSTPIVFDGTYNYVIISASQTNNLKFPAANSETNQVSINLSDSDKWPSPSIGGWQVKLYVLQTLVALQYIKVIPAGENGEDGVAGETVAVPGDSYDLTDEYYSVGTSSSQAPGGWPTAKTYDSSPNIGTAWHLDAIPSGENGYGKTRPYLWNGLVVHVKHYTTSTNYDTYYQVKPSHCISHWAEDGEDGTDGKDGLSIKTLHHFYKTSTTNSAITHNFSGYIGQTNNKICNDASNAGWKVDTAPNLDENNRYLWEWVSTISTEDKVMSLTMPWLAGAYGTPGNDGADGKDGLQGSIIRMRGLYSDLYNTNGTFNGNYLCYKCNDSSTQDGLTFIDIVYTEDGSLYQCNASANLGYGRVQAKSSINPASSSYYVKANKYKFIASDLIISDNILNKIFLTELIFLYDNGVATNITGGIAGNAAKNNGYFIWLGGTVTTKIGTKTTTNVNVNTTDVSAGAFSAVENPVFGIKHDGSGQLANGDITWDKDGNANFKGTIRANAGYFNGTVTATDGVFNGTVNANSGTFHGTIEATDGYFNGTVNANSGVFKGDIQAESFTVLNSNNLPSLVLDTWSSTLAENNSNLGIPAETPVLIVTTYSGTTIDTIKKLYVINLTEINDGTNTYTYTDTIHFYYSIDKNTLLNGKSNPLFGIDTGSTNEASLYRIRIVSNGDETIFYSSTSSNPTRISEAYYVYKNYTSFQSVVECTGSSNTFVLDGTNVYKITILHIINGVGTTKYLYSYPAYQISLVASGANPYIYLTITSTYYVSNVRSTCNIGAGGKYVITSNGSSSSNSTGSSIEVDDGETTDPENLNYITPSNNFQYFPKNGSTNITVKNAGTTLLQKQTYSNGEIVYLN